jgi:hypothetical protein
MKRWVVVLATAALAGCTVYLPEPDMMMAGGDDARLADLRAGRELYIHKCSGCHSLIPVDRFDGPRWTSEVEEMFRLKKVKLSANDRDRLLRYLTTANGK